MVKLYVNWIKQILNCISKVIKIEAYTAVKAMIQGFFSAHFGLLCSKKNTGLFF